ncbi:MAG: RidA family protein [Spirochaetota bacterium]|nr:RidA family protein [Spirochaetota bacterium]
MIEREKIQSGGSPKAIGPYSQGIKANGFVFTSGILPLDIESGEVVPGGIEAETRKTIENLKAVLEEGGASLETVVKTTVFMTNMGDFAEMNRVYDEYFGKALPARATVEVGALAKGAQVEIEAVALT